MTARIYLEGGGDSKDLHTRCRAGFAGLLAHMGYAGRMPRLIACGGRDQAYGDFVTAVRHCTSGDWVALWVDSEEPMADIEKAWAHFQTRDGWDRPPAATDDDVLLMVTCMETWLVADRRTLGRHYGAPLREKALPALVDLELRSRDVVQNALAKATEDCPGPYRKGKRSFALLAAADPATVEQHCPSLGRCRRVLNSRL